MFQPPQYRSTVSTSNQLYEESRGGDQTSIWPEPRDFWAASVVLTCSGSSSGIFSTRSPFINVETIAGGDPCLFSSAPAPKAATVSEPTISEQTVSLLFSSCSLPTLPLWSFYGRKMASTLYTNATIITVNPDRHVIRDGWILVVGNLIAAIGPTSKIKSSLDVPVDTKIVSLHGKIVIPGLINAHAHLIQSLIRGLAEGMPLHQWACDTIWPMEAAFEAEDGYIAAKLTMAEMLKTGTTCFLEPMLPVQAGFDKISRAVGEVGIRACLVRFSEHTFI